MKDVPLATGTDALSLLYVNKERGVVRRAMSWCGADAAAGSRCLAAGTVSLFQVNRERGFVCRTRRCEAGAGSCCSRTDTVALSAVLVNRETGLVRRTWSCGAGAGADAGAGAGRDLFCIGCFLAWSSVLGCGKSLSELTTERTSAGSIPNWSETGSVPSEIH